MVEMTTTEDIMKLKVSELKEELAKRGLSASGLKSELQAKLESSVEEEQRIVAGGAPSTPVSAANKTPSKPKTPSVATRAATPKGAGKAKTPAKAAIAKPKAKTPPTEKKEIVPDSEDDAEEGQQPPATSAKPKSAKKAATPKAAKQATPKSKAATPKAAPSPKNAVEAQSLSPPFHFEFGGPLGSCGVMVGLPLVIYGLFFFCGGIAESSADSPGGFCLPSGVWPQELLDLSREHVVSKLPPFNEWWSRKGFAVCVGWLAFQAALERTLPGEVVEGAVLSDGPRLQYKLNGHLAFWVSLLAMGHACPRFNAESGALEGVGAFPLHQVYDDFLGIITAAVAISLALSAAVFAASFKAGAMLAEGGKSGNPVYDFFIGRELNPRIGNLDLKFFCELRPGLIGWVVLNLGMAMKQRELTGSVSAPMVLVNLFQGLYVWDALFYERAILTTMDITTDGFGFMLAFGDLAWVPLTYTLQARYLVRHDPNLPAWALVAIALLNCGGYAVFRGANSQKDAFRRDPSAESVKHLKFMPTTRGTKLLVSGWWGAARKINYTGDWCMGLSWCLLTGFGSFLTYFYALYFGVLLVHRAIRDDAMCTEKYGAKDWGAYKKAVPATFIPGLPF